MRKHYSIYIPISYSPLYHSEVKVAQLCPTLYDPMGCIVHGILQARILEWVAFPFSRGSSQPRNWTRVSCIPDRFCTKWAYQGSPKEDQREVEQTRSLRKSTENTMSHSGRCYNITPYWWERRSSFTQYKPCRHLRWNSLIWAKTSRWEWGKGVLRKKILWAMIRVVIKPTVSLPSLLPLFIYTHTYIKRIEWMAWYAKDFSYS